ncbi:MAG: ribonuclease H-like domain-containing protein [Pseudomonadota bacterium]
MASRSFASRLNALNRQLGKFPTTEALPPLPSEQTSPRDQAEQALSDELGGDLDPSGLIIRRQVFTDADQLAGHRVGRGLHRALRETFCTEPGRIAILDTETTGLAGGVGTFAFLVGVLICPKPPAPITLYQLLLTRINGETSLLRQLCAYLDDVDTLITYNGKSFDLPLLLSRAQLHRVHLPIDFAHLDLVHPMRAAFRGRWSDCRLMTAERQLLGLHRHDDIPGAEIPAVYQMWLRHCQWNSLKRVIEHNAADLLALTILPQPLADAIHSPQRRNANVAAGARWHLARNDREAALAHLLKHFERLSHSEEQLLAELARGHADAVGIWNKLAARDNTVALLQLAKHFEHRKKDHALALRYAQRALAHQPHDPAHHHRIARLSRKLDSLTHST